MKPTRIAVGGTGRLRRAVRETPEGIALRQEICARYEPKLRAAGFFTRIILRWRLEAELRRALACRLPSDQALF